MVKAVAIFDGDDICCNGFTIKLGFLTWFVINGQGDIVEDNLTLEQAIAYCLEN